VTHRALYPGAAEDALYKLMLSVQQTLIWSRRPLCRARPAVLG